MDYSKIITTPSLALDSSCYGKFFTKGEQNVENTTYINLIYNLKTSYASWQDGISPRWGHVYFP